MFSVVSSQTGCARLCMPSAPLWLLSWSVNGFTPLPPPLFSFPPPVMPLTKRWDLHNMHAVEASEEGYILYKIASTPQQVVKEMLFFKNSKQRVTALQPVAQDCRITWNSQVSLWPDGSTTCVSRTVIWFQVAIRSPAWCSGNHWTTWIKKSRKWWLRMGNTLTHAHTQASITGPSGIYPTNSLRLLP